MLALYFVLPCDNACRYAVPPLIKVVLHHIHLCFMILELLIKANDPTEFEILFCRYRCDKLIMETGFRYHWESVYKTKSLQEVSWYEDVPTTSLQFLLEANLPFDAKSIDIGGEQYINTYLSVIETGLKENGDKMGST